MNNKLINIEGERFGKLTVIENFAGRDKHDRMLCKCKCNCGNIIIVPRYKVLSGERTNCGCSKTENNEPSKLDIATNSIKEYITGLKDGTINGKIGATRYVK